MKTITTLMLAAAFLFARPAFAGVDEAPKAEKKADKKADKADKRADKTEKKDEKKDEKKAEKGGW